MPRDLDEDASSPLDLSPRDTDVGRVPSRPAEPPPLKWGLAGAFHQTGDLLAAPGSTGVVRFISSGVEYTPPPLAGSQIWRVVPSELGRFEMVWPGDPAAARTLLALRRDLETAARAGKLANPGHPLLRELDDTAAALTTLAGRLHRNRWSLGLLQPANVVLREGPSGREAVPVDLGFTWRGTFGAPPWDESPGRPDWLDPDSQPVWLWDHDPVRQQFANPGNGVYPPADAAADVRTLGRLFAWLVSGQSSRELPAIGGATGPPPAWAALADATGGRIASVEAFADRLRAAPLSLYFCPPVAPLPPPAPLLRMIGLIAIALVGIAGVGVGVYMLYPKANGRGDNDGTEQTKSAHPSHSVAVLAVGGPGEAARPAPPEDANLAALLSFVDEALAKSDVNALYASLQKLAAAPRGKPELDARRGKALAVWVTEAQKGIALASNPARRLDAKARLDELVTELTALTRAAPAADPEQKAKEEQCLVHVSLVAQQLALPRSP